MPIHRMKDIQGVQTEILLQSYSDRTMVLVTQMGKVGSLVCAYIPFSRCILYNKLNTWQIQATIPATIPLPEIPNSLSEDISLPEPPVSIVLTPLLGTAPSPHLQTLTDIYVSQIATLIWCSNPASRAPVIVGFNMMRPKQSEEEESTNEMDREKYLVIMNTVLEMLTQAKQESLQRLR
jgi:proteasome assembly chaperone 3